MVEMLDAFLSELLVGCPAALKYVIVGFFRGFASWVDRGWVVAIMVKFSEGWQPVVGEFYGCVST